MNDKPQEAAPELERTPEPIADTPEPQVEARAPEPAPPAEPEPAPAATPSSLRGDKMKEIADRLRKKREGDGAPEFSGDMSDPSQTYGSVAGRQDAPEPPPEPAAPAAEAPPDAPEKRRMRLKVLGEEREYDEDQVIALAQKSAAGDDYLEQARRIRDEAKNPQRAPADRPDQDDHRVQDVDLVPEPDPNQDYVKLVEDIQFGDPKEAALKFKEALMKASGEGATKALIESQMRDDWDQTKIAFLKFKEDNPDLVKDKNAEKVIQSLIVESYQEDLRTIGVPEDRIPKDPDYLADLHRYYRVQRRAVRSPAKVLDDAKAEYFKWRGAPADTKASPSTPPSRQTQPRVAVARDERRASIPTQPTRSTAPQSSAPAAPAAEGQRRSQVIQKMKAARQGTA